MAGFEVTPYGRFCLTPEGTTILFRFLRKIKYCDAMPYGYTHRKRGDRLFLSQKGAPRGLAQPSGDDPYLGTGG
jgi:hypothetical protein